MNFPIEIKTWQDWFQLRDHICKLLHFDQCGLEHWAYIDFNPSYRWVETKALKSERKLASDFKSELIPFTITWMNFRFGRISTYPEYPSVKPSRRIYVTLTQGE